jgi:hypothetical protein
VIYHLLPHYPLPTYIALSHISRNRLTAHSPVEEVGAQCQLISMKWEKGNYNRFLNFWFGADAAGQGWLEV